MPTRASDITAATKANFDILQRAVVAVTRAGNVMLAGSAVAVLGDDPLTEFVATRLPQLGAHVVEPAAARFIFIAPDALAHASSFPHATYVPLAATDTAFTAAANTLIAALGVGDEVRAGLVKTTSGALVVTDPRPDFTASDTAARIDWARQQMPVLQQMLPALAPLAGQKVLVSLVLEPKTAALVLAMQAAGIEVAVFAGTGETDVQVSEYLAARAVPVFAPGGSPHAGATDRANALAALDWQPHWLIDDGAHLVRLAHAESLPGFMSVQGVAEETTSGVTPLRQMADAGVLQVPVIAVNDAPTKTLFDNRVGTGESCVFTLAAELGHPLAGKKIAIFGYGPVGYGTARAAAGLGATVSIVELDALRALQANTDGYALLSAETALATADIIISATGYRHTLTAAQLLAARPGCIFAVAGGVNDELELAPLSPAQRAKLTVLADGDGINYTAGEGNPCEVMDLSFATQVAALAELAAGTFREPGVYALPASAVAQIARAAARVVAPDTIAEARAGDPQVNSWKNHRFLATQQAPSNNN